MDQTEQNSLPECAIMVHEDIGEADEYINMCCPLCSGQLRLYQIHYDEKFLMCANIDCPYPIGITDYHIYKVECNEEFSRGSAGGSSFTSGSMISHSDWTELDKLVQLGCPYSPMSTPPHTLIEKTPEMEKLEEIKKMQEQEKIMRNNVKKIKELNKQLYDNNMVEISSTKWIEKIAKMEERSGVQLLKENELKKVKVKPGIGVEDLKIDVDSSKNVISLELKITDNNENK